MPKPSPRVVITTLGITQILAWGCSFYLPAVLARPIADDTGWSLGWVVGGLSLGLLAAGLVAPRVGRTIDAKGGRPVLTASSILLGSGLATLALAHSLPVYLMAWLLMGVGMGAGLYDAAFATLGRLYGREARRAIHHPDPVGWFCQHRLLALERLVRGAFRLAGRLRGL